MPTITALRRIPAIKMLNMTRKLLNEEGSKVVLNK
jgi:hypothetical protein